jgi:C4-dicarboxylate transporter DctM subunit
MSNLDIGTLSVVILLGLIYLGMHIGPALLIVSYGCVFFMKGPDVASRILGGAATDSVREYLFGVAPLFILMGMFVTQSGLGRDTFDLVGRIFHRIRAGLGIATVGANAAFAAITGVSLASATVFSKVAVPELVRSGYRIEFATGVVAGSSVLGMLIPPSLLMIFFGILSEESVGKLFIAGLLPGILMAVIFSLIIYLRAKFSAGTIFEGGKPIEAHFEPLPNTALMAKAFPILALITLVLGGIYGGVFTPTEAGAAGALGALIIALMRRSLTVKSFWTLLSESGHVTVAVLLLIIGATLYSRMLTLSGLPLAATNWLADLNLGAAEFILAYVLLVVVMGCMLDGISIMLITLPIVLPIVRAMDIDVIWFSVVTIIAIEMGLITPPFGLSVFTVKTAVTSFQVTVAQVFRGSMPFLLGMFLTIIILMLFPGIVTFLPSRIS